MNLGSDDRIILVGDGSAVQGPLGNVNQMLVSSTRVAWRSAFGLSAGELQGESFTRRTNLGAGDNAVLFDTTPPGAFFGGQEGQLNTMYAFNLPAGILTSQGLV